MEKGRDWGAELRALDAEAIPGFLRENSGLPGPRANLTLMRAFAEIAPADQVLGLAVQDQEYLRCAGVVGVGRLITEDDDRRRNVFVDLLRERSRESWRIREAVAMALQMVGDTDRRLLREIIADWSRSGDPLVLRAAAAGICEPRLLLDPATCAAALDACGRATSWLAALPTARRREDDVRTLRKGLGYCWSVAVAADPAQGLPLFARLADQGRADPDVEWIVRENQRKARLRRLLDS